MSTIIRNSFVNPSKLSTSIQIQHSLQYYGRKKETNVSLKALMETANGSYLQKPNGGFLNQHQDMIRQVACFLHRELPVRLAHRVCELEATDLFKRSEGIVDVCNLYKTSFYELTQCEAPNDMKKEEIFAKIIESIYERHAASMINMAKGAHEIRTMLLQDTSSFAEHHTLQTRLDDFYASRIGIRMLIGQYLALREPSKDPNILGLISTCASPYHIALQAINDATYICRSTYGYAPEVIIHGRTDLHFPYATSHISYMLLELLKNSMRATIQLHGLEKMPPIRIVIADGEDNEDVVIRVSDEGGGIKRSDMSKIWSYLFSTADPVILNKILGVNGEKPDIMTGFDTTPPLAGLGYGLPLSRNYARYFGGELNIMSMEGYGTNSFIYLPRLSATNFINCSI